MSKRDLIIFMFKWKASLAGMFLLIVGVASVFIFVAPPSYSANAKVLVERNRPPVLRSVLAPSMDLAEALNTEAEILLSRSVMTAVVDKLRPHERPRKPSTVGNLVDASRVWMEDTGLLYAQSPRDRWITALGRNVKVKPSIDSSILRVTYGDEDPEWAARTVNAVVAEYLAHHVRVFTTRGSAALFQERMQSTEADLRKQRTELAALKRSLALSAVDDTKRDLVRRAGELGAQAQTAQTEFDTLLLRFEKGHREVELANTKLARLKSAAEQLLRELARIEAQQARLDGLQLEIGALETTYRDYAKRHDEAQLTDLASANSVNVGTVDAADVPSKPDNSRLFLLVIASAMALVLSALIAIVREYFDRKLATPAAAEDILGLPELGSVALLPRRWRAALRGTG